MDSGVVVSLDERRRNPAVNWLCPEDSGLDLSCEVGGVERQRQNRVAVENSYIKTVLAGGERLSNLEDGSSLKISLLASQVCASVPLGEE